MGELSREGVQAVSSLVFNRERPVQPVVHDVKARKGELGSYLVGDAGADYDFEKGAFLVRVRCLRNRLERRHGVKGLELRSLGIR